MSISGTTYVLLYILPCNVEGWSTTLFHPRIIPSTVLCVISPLLVVTRSVIKTSVDISDSTVISPITTEAHNLNITDASTALRDDGSPATVHTTTPKTVSYLPHHHHYW